MHIQCCLQRTAERDSTGGDGTARPGEQHRRPPGRPQALRSLQAGTVLSGRQVRTWVWTENPGGESTILVQKREGPPKIKDSCGFLALQGPRHLLSMGQRPESRLTASPGWLARSNRGNAQEAPPLPGAGFPGFFWGETRENGSWCQGCARPAWGGGLTLTAPQD